MSAGPAAVSRLPREMTEVNDPPVPRLPISSGVTYPDIKDAKVTLIDRKWAGDARTDRKSGSAEWRRSADLVVVGSGAAGIAVALTAAARGLRVLVVTKDLVGGATPLAQGGLAAALGAGDTPAAHARDTVVAGAGLCAPDVVTALAQSAPGAIGWLAGLGARLETSDLRLEGGHSARRIVHCGDDATGAEVHRALLAALLASGIEILDRTVALDLLLREPVALAGPGPGPEHAGGVAGQRAVAGLAAAFIRANGRLVPGAVAARAVVIAAGGLGQAFGTTSNPAGATGDGIALAARAGAVIRDLEFVQFHPTVLWLPGASGQCPLVTEALRGAGAVLRELDGTPLMAGHDPRGDLAPRDVVAARMAEVIAAGGAGHVWLDATALGRDLLENGFPTVTAACRKHGIDPVTDLIPVAPGAHYSCGGIRADLDGRTSVPGLYAAGEAASTGVQGANRLASNSVTEAVIAGRRTGTAIAAALAGGAALADSARPAETGGGPARTGTGPVLVTATTSPGEASGRDRGSTEENGPSTAAERHFCPDLPPVLDGDSDDRGSSAANSAADDPRSRPGLAGRGELAQAMARYAGVMRDADGLRELLRIIAEAGSFADSTTCGCGAKPTASGAPPRSSAGEPTGQACSDDLGQAGGLAGNGWGARPTASGALAWSSAGEPTGRAGDDVLGRTGESAGRGGRFSGGREVERGTVRDCLDLDLDGVEAANLRTVSLLIAAGALRRAESRGCHRRRDAGGASATPWHTLARWDGRELVLTEEAL